MRYLFFFFTILLLGVSSCTPDPKNSTTETDSSSTESEVDQPKIHQTPDQPSTVTSSGPDENDKDVLKRTIEASLSIPSSETYALNFHTSDCNGDGVKDLIATVNLKERAINKAIESGNIAKYASTGYMGYNNYFFYMNGASKKISESISIPSSAYAPLELNFEPIASISHNDIIVDYRIKEACFRAFYSVVNDVPIRTLRVKLFDNLGNDNVESYVVQYEPGKYSSSKDIVVYEGTLDNPTFEDPLEVYDFTPEITTTGKESIRWFFNAGQFKYFTEN